MPVPGECAIVAIAGMWSLSVANLIRASDRSFRYGPEETLNDEMNEINAQQRNCGQKDTGPKMSTSTLLLSSVATHLTATNAAEIIETVLSATSTEAAQ